MTASVPRRRFGRLATVIAGLAAALLGAAGQDNAPKAQNASPGPGGSFAAANVCIGCHSPDAGPPLSGRMLGAWLAPNITPHPVSGIGAWSREDLFRYLRNGYAPGRGQAGGPMAPMVETLQSRPDEEIYALIDWMMKQPAHRDPAETVTASQLGQKLTLDPALLRASLSENPDPEQLGAQLYNASCASCHGADGAGSPDGRYPSMFHNSSVGRRTNLIAALLDGVERHMKTETAFMQSFDGKKGIPGGLSEDQLTVLSNFVLKQFGDPADATATSADIGKARLGWYGEGEPTAERGQLIAVGGGPGGASLACVGCHGVLGEGEGGAGFPRLAGLDAHYIAKQMQDYASDKRAPGLMASIAKQLSAADNHSLGLYYAGLPFHGPKVRASAPDPALVKRGETLYHQGSTERGIQACGACHGPTAGGLNPIYPALVQPAAYTGGQLRQWRERTRRNDVHDLMGAVARAMNDEDVGAVSAYLAGLAP
jgi:cytochrome c553